MNNNKIISFIIIVLCAFLVIGFIPIPYIEKIISPWSYDLFFLIPLFLFITAYKFKKINDLKGKRLAYIGIFSLVASPFFPVLLMLILWSLSFPLTGIISLVVLGILPVIGVILSVYVSLRLWKNTEYTVIQELPMGGHLNSDNLIK